MPFRCQGVWRGKSSPHAVRRSGPRAHAVTTDAAGGTVLSDEGESMPSTVDRKGHRDDSGRGPAGRGVDGHRGAGAGRLRFGQRRDPRAGPRGRRGAGLPAQRSGPQHDHRLRRTRWAWCCPTSRTRSSTVPCAGSPTRHGRAATRCCWPTPTRTSRRSARPSSVLAERRVDGLIVCPTDDGDHAHLEARHPSGIPVVLLDRRVSGLARGHRRASTTARRQGDATHPLIEQGHRRIGILTGGTPTAVGRRLSTPGMNGRRAALAATTVGARAAGYRDALLAAAGLAQARVPQRQRLPPRGRRRGHRRC